MSHLKGVVKMFKQGQISRQEEIKELLWAELYTKDSSWRKELSKEDKEILKLIEDDFKNRERKQ